MPSFAVCATHETYAGQNMRFAAVVRAFVPLVSGILRMSPLQFYAANILSAFAWAPAHIFPGVLLVAQSSAQFSYLQGWLLRPLLSLPRARYVA